MSSKLYCTLGGNKVIVEGNTGSEDWLLTFSGRGGGVGVHIEILSEDGVWL